MRIIGDLGADPVGLIFAGAADGHLHQPRRHGRQQHQGDGPDQTARTLAVVAAAEEEREIGQHGDGARHRRRHRHGQGVAVLHVGQFVRHHPAHLLARQHVQQAAGRGDGGVLRIAAGGEGVGLVVGDDGDGRQGQARIGRHLLHVGDIGPDHGVGVGLVHHLGPVHLQHDLVGVPVAEQVHPRRHKQGDHHAGRAADQIAQTHEQGGHHGQQGEGLEMVHAVQAASGVAKKS
ncbi:hypothetical protein D3C72_903170 [compost metagenome]